MTDKEFVERVQNVMTNYNETEVDNLFIAWQEMLSKGKLVSQEALDSYVTLVEWNDIRG